MTFALHSDCNPGNFTPISWTFIGRTFFFIFFLCQSPYELNNTFKRTQVIFYVSCVTHILFLTKVTISLMKSARECSSETKTTSRGHRAAAAFAASAENLFCSVANMVQFGASCPDRENGYFDYFWIFSCSSLRITEYTILLQNKQTHSV